MSDQKDRKIGQWHNPLLKTEERDEVRQELTDAEISEFSRIWESAAEYRPPKGLSVKDRLASLEEKIDEDLRVVPMYRSKSFKNAVAAFVAASVLFGLLYTLKPDNVLYDQQFLTEIGSRKEISLPDGSIVQLNASSELKFSSEGWKKQRNVSLIGEAFFDVKPSDVPFVVSTGLTNVTVLGTSFNVKNRNDHSLISCLSGKVSVDYDGAGRVVLTKGLATQVYEGKSPTNPYEIEIDQIDSWIDGKYYFRETPLNEVFEELERQFAIAIISDLDFTSQKFTGYFMDEDLQKSLSIICMSAGLNFNINGSNVEIYN